MKNNKDLKKIYDQIFSAGEEKHFTKMLEKGQNLPSDETEVLGEISWKGKKVLDVGCGTGLFAYQASLNGAVVIGLDYSKEAIDIAKERYINPNLQFLNMDVKDLKGKFDVIVSLGTLEHLDDPFEMAKFLKSHLNPKGEMVFTCPNWNNPRGYVLLTLFHLFDAPITLADIHYFSPNDFQNWAKKLKMSLEWRTFDVNRAYGENLIKDFEKRLPKVLKETKSIKPVKEENIKKLLLWMKANEEFVDSKAKHIGASALYHLKKD